MEPVKKGDVLYCDKCGVELIVSKSCGCEPCEIICCSKPMKIKKSKKTNLAVVENKKGNIMANPWDSIIGTREYNENLARIKKIAEANNYILNPDHARIEKVIGLMTMNKESAGKYFCPCKQSHPLDSAKDKTCPCPELDKEVNQTGNCNCRVFFKKL